MRSEALLFLFEERRRRASLVLNVISCFDEYRALRVQMLTTSEALGVKDDTTGMPSLGEVSTPRRQGARLRPRTGDTAAIKTKNGAREHRGSDRRWGRGDQSRERLSRPASSVHLTRSRCNPTTTTTHVHERAEWQSSREL